MATAQKKQNAHKDMTFQKKDKSFSEKKVNVSGRGFASMPREKVIEIAKKGGQARAEQLGHDGYVELGQKGGEARAGQLGHEGYVEMGRKGGQVRSGQLGHQGYVELGHKGGQAKSSHRDMHGSSKSKHR